MVRNDHRPDLPSWSLLSMLVVGPFPKVISVATTEEVAGKPGGQWKG